MRSMSAIRQVLDSMLDLKIGYLLIRVHGQWKQAFPTTRRSHYYKAPSVRPLALARRGYACRGPLLYYSIKMQRA
jgi:hypothetical protein